MIDYNNPNINKNNKSSAGSILNALNKLIVFAIFLAFIVIMLGAYTRLTEAGLGCPDWPGCYGQMIVDNKNNNIIDFNSTKAWTEMIHRYLAGSLGICIFLITFGSYYKNLKNLSINRKYNIKPFIIPTLLLSCLVFQALLGMWTVTLKLLPVVVMGHLIGGFATICLLVLLLLSNLDFQNKIKFKTSLKLLCGLALLALFMQIILGGWTSANYAAVPCIDFPACNGQFLPLKDTTIAMNPFYQIGPKYSNYEGGVLTNSLRVTIQLFHRWGAFITALIIIITACKLSKIESSYYKKFSNWLLFLLILQIMLGIINVKLALPLINAVMHNLTACLLLISLVILNYKINYKKL